MKTGWELRPLGWLVLALALLIGVVLYYMLIKRTYPPQDDPQTH